jgi:radical SAM protein with 4Fe4S-binding SPASM domain
MLAASLVDKFKNINSNYRGRVAGFKKPAAYANWLLSNYEMWRRTTTIKAKPLKLTVDLTNSCQLRCPLCPTGLQAHDRDATLYSLEQFTKLMEDVGDYVFFIDFYNWGEPLNNKNFDKYVEVAKRYNVSTEISSNFSFKLSDDRIRRLVESGLNEIIVSMDGTTQETYEQYRRKGQIDLVQDNIRRFIKLRTELGRTSPVITWRYLVFGFNEHEIEDAKVMSKDLGVDKIMFFPAFLDEDNYFPTTDVDKITIVDTWVPADPEYKMYDVSKTGKLISHHDKAPFLKRCDWHYMSAAINADGSVAPCCVAFKKEDDFGNLDDDGSSYMSVVNNEKYRGIRAKFAGKESKSPESICDKCPATNIMPYAKDVNKAILIVTVLQILGLFRGLFKKHDRPVVQEQQS